MEEKEQVTCSRREILPAFLGVAAGSVVLYLLLSNLQPMVSKNTFLYDFGTMIGACMKGALGGKVEWFFADITEAAFLASMPASLLMCIMGFVAAYLEKKKSPHAGTGVDGNSGVFKWMFIAMIISLILGQIMYDWAFPMGWIPTFAAFLTVQVFIAFYGVSPAKVITSIVVGTIVTFPVCNFFLQKVVNPCKLPLFVAVSIGVFFTVPICSELFRLMPWMKKAPAPAPDPSAAPAPKPSPGKFFVHRVFGDIGELTIWGSSLAAIGMYVGAIISWILNPLHPCYSLGNFPLVMSAQILTAALAIFIWYPKWKKGGWAFTFAGVVFVSAVLCTYPNSWVIVIPTIIIGAVIFAPLVEWILKVVHYNGRWHAITFIQLAIFSTCTIWSLIILHVIMPLIS